MNNSYNTHPNDITTADFDSGHNFGVEGLVPLSQHREYKDISKDDLLYFLTMTAKAVAPDKQKKVLDAVNNGLVERVLGDKQSYNVSESLARLRGLVEGNFETHLLQRTLSLISFDLLDPASVSQIIPANVYDDLHITDTNIQPEMRKGGANLVYKLLLFQDGERRVAFQIYPPGKNCEIKQDNLVHEHNGPAGSLILAGQLLNQHYDVNILHDVDEAPLSAYAVTYDVPPRSGSTASSSGNTESIRPINKFTKIGGAEFKQISQRVYHPGMHYLLPPPYREGSESSFPYDLTPQDKMTFHKIGTNGLTATLFTIGYHGKYDPLDADHISTDDSTKGETFTRSHADRTMVPQEAAKLIEAVDVLIRQQLGLRSAPSTVLDRGADNIVTSRMTIHKRTQGSHK